MREKKSEQVLRWKVNSLEHIRKKIKRKRHTNRYRRETYQCIEDRIIEHTKVVTETAEDTLEKRKMGNKIER